MVKPYLQIALPPQEHAKLRLEQRWTKHNGHPATLLCEWVEPHLWAMGAAHLSINLVFGTRVGRLKRPSAIMTMYSNGAGVISVDYKGNSNP